MDSNCSTSRPCVTILIFVRFSYVRVCLWYSADLSEAVDVYSDWVDACEAAN